MDIAHQFDGIGNAPFRLRPEEFANGELGRTPDGAVSQSGEVLVDEQRGTLVGENNSRP